MRLFDILKEFMDSKEAKIRLARGSILVNQEVVTDPNMQLEVQDGYWEAGEFIYYNCENPSFYRMLTLEVFDVKDFFGPEPTNVDGFQVLTGFTLIQIAKYTFYVFMNK